MELQPVERQSVPDAVFDQIVARIVDGGFAAGADLPSERRLAELLGVSRPAVREALVRLEQSGLVDTRHGGGSTVRDYQRHASLDLLPHLMTTGGGIDTAVGRSVVEARALIGPAIAELAAERQGVEVAEHLDVVLGQMAQTDDDIALQQLSLLFWEHVVDAADSIAFRLMFNGMRAAYEPLLGALATVLHDEVADHASYRRVRDAIASGDGAKARRSASALLARGAEAISKVLHVLDEEGTSQ